MNDEELVEVIAELFRIAEHKEPFATGYAEEALTALRSAGFQVYRPTGGACFVKYPGSEEIWWCKTHRVSGGKASQCTHSELVTYRPLNPCSMVRAFLLAEDPHRGRERMSDERLMEVMAEGMHNANHCPSDGPGTWLPEAHSGGLG